MTPEIVGVSADGWLAFSEAGEGDIQITNLTCEEPDCVSDSPTHDGDLCYCPPPGDDTLLDAFGIERGGTLESGTFPAEIDGNRYLLTSVPGTRPGIVLGTQTEVTEVWLLREGGDRQRLGAIDDHLTPNLELVCAAGWMRFTRADGNFIAVLVGYGIPENADEPNVVRFRIFGAVLR